MANLVCVAGKCMNSLHTLDCGFTLLYFILPRQNFQSNGHTKKKRGVASTLFSPRLGVSFLIFSDVGV